jgi:hypothetical protein
LSADIVPFPGEFRREPIIREIEIPEPYRLANGALLTITDQEALDAEAWTERTFRLIVTVPAPTADQFNDQSCAQALARLAREFTRTCFGEFPIVLLPFVGLLERTEEGLCFTVIVMVPDYAKLVDFEAAAKKTFSDVLGVEFDRSAHHASSEAAPDQSAVEFAHLMMRTACSRGPCL